MNNNNNNKIKKKKRGGEKKVYGSFYKIFLGFVFFLMLEVKGPLKKGKFLALYQFSVSGVDQNGTSGWLCEVN